MTEGSEVAYFFVIPAQAGIQNGPVTNVRTYTVRGYYCKRLAGDVKKYRMDQDERALLKSFNRGEWKPVRDRDRELARHRGIARNTLLDGAEGTPMPDSIPITEDE